MTTRAVTSEPEFLRGAVLVKPCSPGASAHQWILDEREWIEDAMKRRGALLLRGFAEISLDEFQDIATAVGGTAPQPYENRSTPRTNIKGNIYTSTEYPASEEIPLHNENSYSHSWPRHIFFLCQQPSAKGGETPIADSRKVYASLPDRTRDAFEARGVAYVRNYGVLGLSWEETFQTSSRDSVEQYCRANDIECSWTQGGGLRTRQTLPASRIHPITGEPVWFNQAHLFHVSNLGAIASELIAMVGKEGLPRNAVLGDGSDIDLELLNHVRLSYSRHAAPVSWMKNDLVILDNMLWAHGRRPYSGSRKILVAMTN